MSIEFVIYIILGIPVMLLAVASYISVLLAIAKRFTGVIKAIISAVVYFAFSGVIISPMIILGDVIQPPIQDSTSSFIIVLVGFVIITVPGMYYLSKVRIKELQKAGYFLPRG
jgi:hypothetical protein